MHFRGPECPSRGTKLDLQWVIEFGAGEGNRIMDEKPFHGVSFSFDRAKDWHLTDDVCAANPTCSHAGNLKGVKIKLQVSTREQPVLPVRPLPQLISLAPEPAATWRS